MWLSASSTHLWSVLQNSYFVLGLTRTFCSNAFTDIFCTSCAIIVWIMFRNFELGVEQATLKVTETAMHCFKPKTHSRLLLSKLCTFLSICSFFSFFFKPGYIHQFLIFFLNLNLHTGRFKYVYSNWTHLTKANIIHRWYQAFPTSVEFHVILRLLIITLPFCHNSNFFSLLNEESFTYIYLMIFLFLIVVQS